MLTAIFDTYVPIGLLASVIPFTSGFRPFPIALGTAAFDLLLAVAVTSAARGFLSARVWRGAHWLAYACWPVAFVHGLLVGTDLRFGWMQILSGACAAAVLSSIVWRIWADPYRRGFQTADPQDVGGRTAFNRPSTRAGRAERPTIAARSRSIARYTWTDRR